ncbi:MAG: flagellar basal-body MS-ring/collar protein FliF [Spirochaetaceae bacterium]
MSDWIKQRREQLSQLWSKWTTVQKIVFAGIAIAAVAGVIALLSISAAPSRVPLLTRPVTDPELLDRISFRLDEENVPYTIENDNRIMVEDEPTARRMRSVLTREQLIPPNTDPWELFDIERWTQTDFERNVNLQRSITRALEQHIVALEEVDTASVTIVIPDDRLFSEDQQPVTASVIIQPRPGSDIRENRRKIEGIERLIMFAVEGLAAENITINDLSGVVLNDFESLAEFDDLELRRRELEVTRDLEEQYISSIRSALEGIFGADRVRVANINVDLDFGKFTRESEEFSPITTRVDNPRTPFDDSEFVLNIPRSERDFLEEFEGTGFNPEGPPGQEGQTPPEYLDRAGVVGSYTRDETTRNFELNRTVTNETGAPSVERISVGVALDGRWEWEYDDNGNVVMNPDGSISRTYVPITPEDIETARELVEAAVGFTSERGDQVRVQHLQFNREDEHREEDDVFRRQRQIQQIILYSLLGLAALLALFIVVRIIQRELERRRRRREEELARQHQAMREAALRSAEDEGTEVEMSVEERARMEMHENAINMAREHPEDVAQLIRTWLMEE